MNRLAPVLLSVLRIAAALLFVEHGTQKVLHFPPAAAPAGGGHAMAGIMAHLAPASGYIELIGGAMLLVGLLTRPVAFLLSGEMAVAYFAVHAKGDFYPINNHGELAALYCFVFLYLAAAGAGPISIDKLIKRA